MLLDIQEMEKWYTIVEHVDKDTGELLTKARVEREFWVKVGTERTVERKPTYNISKITNIYEANKQTRLF